MTEIPLGDTDKARLLYPNWNIVHYDDGLLAMEDYLDLPKTTRVVFRGKGDTTPVYPHDYVRA